MQETVLKALGVARSRLLDRSLRNKLIHTNVASERANHVRILESDADAVFALIRDGRTAGFDAVPPRPLAAGAASTDVAISRDPGRLGARMSDEALKRRLKTLHDDAGDIEEEQGVSILFLALGFLEWREARQPDIPRFAPLVLLPVDLSRDRAQDRFRLRLRPDDLYTNVSLQAWLAETEGLRLPDLPEGEDWAPSDYFARVQTAVASRPNWRVQRGEIVLGFYSFSKFLMWRDLDPASWPQGTSLADHPLLKSILLHASEEGPSDPPLITEDQAVDEVWTPADLVHVTDADSSQAIAIQEALAGRNLVIQGPPGTGKSQTITNIIAGAVKAGKSVLFIAEKKAALEVVHRRLVGVGLSAIALELHSRKAAKTQVLQQIREAMEVGVPPTPSARAFDELAQTQGALRLHSARLHAKAVNGFSPFGLIGHIARLRAGGAPAPTFTLLELAGWTTDQVDAAAHRVRLLGDRLNAAGPPCEHPWRGMGGPTPDALMQDRLQPLVAAFERRVAALGEQTVRVRDHLRAEGLDRLRSLDRWIAGLRHLATRPADVDDALADPGLAAFAGGLLVLADQGEQLADVRQRLQPLVVDAAWSRDWAADRLTIAGQGTSLFRMFSGRYRDAVSSLRGAWNGKLPGRHETRLSAIDDLIEGRRLAAAIDTAGSTLGVALGNRWKGEGTDWAQIRAVAAWISAAQSFRPDLDLPARVATMSPTQADGLAEDLLGALAGLTGALDRIVAETQLSEPIAFGQDRSELTIADLTGLAARWIDRFDSIVDWPPLRDDLSWLESLGAADLAAQAFEGDIRGQGVAGALLLALYEAMWTRARQADPELERTFGDQLNTVVARFRDADRARIRLAADEVARAHAEQRPTGNAGAVGILNAEVRKSRNIKPVRKLMEAAGEAVQRFKPVLMMSPLSVAQFLPPGLVKFDLVIIDEASQVRPEDAIGAIARCDQLVVVGDDKQLPPTDFFNRMINDDSAALEDDEEAPPSLGEPRRAEIEDIESVLNLCSKRFADRMLEWHYRSEHPALIAVSNRRFYGGRLRLPPSVLLGANDGDNGLVFHPVSTGGYDRGKTRRNEIEAEEIAQAALDHARNRPTESLGIAAFSVAQRDAIRERLDLACQRHPELDAFVKGRTEGGEVVEPLFVKNLETIQGDERDVIFISVGYGKDADGRFISSFGPVSQAGGERRLNVLITRARKRCVVFSSIVAEDIVFDGEPKPGVLALREFLKLARDGFIDMPEAGARDFDSDFEASVAQAIVALGYDVRPQVGMSGFFIDLAVIDPRDDRRYLLGIECDGAAYHSSRYARDRDRLRQMILERRGWKLHRIWSTDWFYRGEREIAKIKDAIESALAGRTLPTAAQVFDAHARLDLDETPPPEEPRLRTLRPYDLASFRTGGVEPARLTSGQLARLMARIVDAEQPIHEDEAARRLAQLCGLQRAGSAVRAAALDGLQEARRQGDVAAEGPFWSKDPAAPVDPRSRAALPPADPLRRPEAIAPSEFAAAARIALQENLALARVDLITETARLLGFPRSGKDMRAAIGAAIAERLAAEVEEDHLGRLRRREG